MIHEKFSTPELSNSLEDYIAVSYTHLDVYKRQVDKGCSSRNAQIVAYGSGDVNARPFVLGIDGRLVAKDVGPVFRGEGAAVFPLGKTGTLVVNDLHPSALAAVSYTHLDVYKRQLNARALLHATGVFPV